MRNEQHSNKPASVPGVDELQDAFAGPSIPIEYGLLSPDHRILEWCFMVFPPFGKDSQGEAIRDMGGVSIRSNVEYLEANTSRKAGPEAGRVIVEDLARQLNERIPDPACHVTVDSLKNPWMSYSNEFTAYLVELCIDLSGDPQFQFHMGREKLIPPLIQILMRPFSAGQVSEKLRSTMRDTMRVTLTNWRGSTSPIGRRPCVCVSPRGRSGNSGRIAAPARSSGVRR